MTTALFNQIAQTVPSALSSLRYLLFGGEAVDPQWVKQVLNNGAPQQLLHVYGPTENTTFSSWYLVQDVPEGATTIPIGRPIANTQIYLLDAQLQPVGVGVAGEIYLGGDGLAREYLNRQELTQQKFIPNPFDKSKLKSRKSKLYKTEDLARYLPDGNIQYLGRIDNQVKIRGFRIELGEIEALLSQHSHVQASCVIVREDGQEDILVGTPIANRDRGLPCSIYRLGRVTWDSQTGVWNANDMFYRFITSCIQLQTAPHMNSMVEITPVDYLVKVLIHLSQQPESLGKAFHLISQRWKIL